ncbi:hypothetical protein BFP77_06600 [Maribacter sp. 4U21]|uniref:TlpA family protein disulfide reductase n=1 Tax=Maribacter sp. 4U21 TaxID=1889779 RepID=UPI000C157161|nr:TlpA disulfide reductase family protein [Maribacter sp. 4U21]PIB29330.1 hypothetical protein BFP77_06600 [Maribacter sp. 4U21]
MKFYTSLFIVLLTFGLQAQQSISGNFTPAKDFKWLIAYELTPGSQRYVADTAVNDGYFKLDLPANAVKGMYRLVYAIPQDEFYIDVIYNGAEEISFNFDFEEGVSFTISKENITFDSYFSTIGALESKLVAYYQSGKTSEKEFEAILKELKNTQQGFETRSEGLLVRSFIMANKPYIPKSYEPVTSYFNQKKKRYFEHINVEDNMLQASGFLKDKITNYVFSAIPLEQTSQTEIEKAIQENIRIIAAKLETTPGNFQVAIFHGLWETARENSLNTIAEVIYDNHLKALAIENGQQQLIDEITVQTRLSIGAPSPDITWKENGTTKSLSSLNGAEHYVLVFWSSTCSHCLKEVPALHKELATYENIEVIAVGLEDDEANWNMESAKLPNFHHAIALDKWQSEYAQLFAIQQTPTYFILDKGKRFISKPQTDKEVVAFLKD